MEQEILSTKRDRLLRVIEDSFQQCTPHSAAFVLRILPEIDRQLDLSTIANESTLGHYPQIATLGFSIGSGNKYYTENFLDGLNRLQRRTEPGLQDFASDDIAILGVADGLRHLEDTETTKELKKWLLEIVNISQSTKDWSYRMRALAGDLLDTTGRLKTDPDFDTCGFALEETLRTIWPDQYSQIPEPARDTRRKFFKDLLTQDPSQAEDIEMATIWFKAIDVICDKAVEKILTEEDNAAIELLGKIKSNIDRNAHRTAKRCLLYFLSFFVLVFLIHVGLIFHFGWETMESWTWGVEGVIIIVGYFYYAITLSDPNPVNIFDKLASREQRTMYERLGFDTKKFEQLRQHHNNSK
ncbi:MAG: hypothetical protein F4Y39_17470 [Gemmatimonadetes bacterium]|nr:hypothetical protein [Gemmatimonadota bacterium]